MLKRVADIVTKRQIVFDGDQSSDCGYYETRSSVFHE